MIYLDNSATTKQYDQVTEEMLFAIENNFGNPSSLHGLGVKSEKEIEKSRSGLSGALGVDSDEIIFTGGGTEGNNMALFGVYGKNRRIGKRVITSKAEHPSIIETCRKLEHDGAEVIYADVDSKGRVNIEEIRDNINDSTILISIMTVNNELGTVSPMKEISELIKGRNIVFHTDGVQALGKIPLDLRGWGVDLMSLSSHKIHGPKGMGALYVRKGVKINPLIFGGGQERGLRSGTENTPAIAGFGKAVEILGDKFDERRKTINKTRSYLLEGIKEEILDFVINSPEESYDEEYAEGQMAKCSPGILNVSFLGCPGQVLIHHLEEQGIYASTSAACSSRKGRSRVLTAAGLQNSVIDSAIRFSFNEFNTMDQMELVLSELKKAILAIRKISRYR